MPEVIRFAKGTASEHLNFTGENGEITLICDDTPNRKVTGVIRLHDGQTVGGIPFGGSQLLNDMHDVNAANTIEFQVMTVDANGQFYFANTVETIADGTISGDKIYGGTISTSAAVFEGSSANAIVRITQTGAGNALVVEDSANPDSTPFVVDASGKVGIGTTNPSYPLHISGTGHKRLKIEKTDAGGDADLQISSPNDSTGWILFHDNNSGNNSGVIKYVHSTNKMHFRTNDVDDRLVISSDGNVEIPSGTLRVGENSTSQAYGFSIGYVQTIQAPSGSQTYLSIARPGVSMDNNGLIIGEDNNNSYIAQRNNKNLILATNDQNVVIVSPSVNGTGRKGLQLADNSLAFDESGVRNWEMRANGGYLRVDPGDGYGKMQVSAGLKAKFIQMTSDANDTSFAPEIQGYLGSQLSDGLGAVYYLGHLSSGSSSNASANWVSFYTSGHWGQYTQLVLWGITTYYNSGFSKWHISGTTATQIHGWGNQPSISISQTTAGSGTHAGLNVYRYNITLTNPGIYHGVRWFVGLVGGGGAGHLGSSRSEADADAWFSTRGGGLHLKNCSDANISASPLYNSGV